jgi:small subunit ribosomal protein S3
MWHKVSPISWRIGTTRSWASTGYYDKAEYTLAIQQDVIIRDLIRKFFKGLPVGHVNITHSDAGLRTIIYTSRTALILGKNGENLTKLQKKLTALYGKKVQIDVKEIKNPDVHATLVGDSIGRQIERRLPYRRVIKQAIVKAMEKGAKGIKIRISGRIGGAEIARHELYKEGNVPSQKIKASIDYAVEHALTQYGILGIKIWIYKWDVENN